MPSPPISRPIVLTPPILLLLLLTVLFKQKYNKYIVDTEIPFTIYKLNLESREVSSLQIYTMHNQIKKTLTFQVCPEDVQGPAGLFHPAHWI